MSDINPDHPEVFSFLQTRRSVPAKVMAAPGPSDPEIAALIEIASRVPDHGKIAPWRFVRYMPKYCEKLGQLILDRYRDLNGDPTPEIEQIELTRLTRVPVVIGIISAPKQHPKVPVWEQELSAGAAAMNLLIAANALGYDAQWLTEWYAFDEVLTPKFGVGEGERMAGFLHIGTKTMPKTERDRPPLSRIYSQMDG